MWWRVAKDSTGAGNVQYSQDSGQASSSKIACAAYIAYAESILIVIWQFRSQQVGNLYGHFKYHETAYPES